MADYHTTPRVLSFLHELERAGLNTWQASWSERLEIDWLRYKQEGGKLQLLMLSRPGFNDEPEMLKRAIKLQPMGIAQHGVSTNKFWDAGHFDKSLDYLKRIRDTGAMVGLSCHNPLEVEYSEEHGWDVDYYMTALYYMVRPRAEFEKLTAEVVKIFSGTDLEKYFQELVNSSAVGPVAYRQVNRYAHQRFPNNLQFVRNLLRAYSTGETADRRAHRELLRQYWFYDPSLRTMLFERLSSGGRLYPELESIRAANPGIVNGQFDQAVAANPAAIQFAAEAEAWLSHFEAAAPAARALATAYPGRREFTTKASALYRSLAAYDKQDTEIAVTLAGLEQRANPRDQSILARMGDIFADRELFGKARTFWERMPAEQPGKEEVYLDTATIYWDYYRFNDALRWIAAARSCQPRFSSAVFFSSVSRSSRSSSSLALRYV